MDEKTAAFKTVYNRLNPEQKQAVDTVDGPVMVVAGPGTGKTQVLAARIANILFQTDTKPHNILALTFTESAAKNMRERVVKMIGKAGYYVQISTFHSFCSEIIQSHPEYFPINRGSEPLTDLERYDLFQSIILDLDLEAVKPLNRKLLYIRDIMKRVSDLKREGFMPDDFAKIITANREKFEAEKAELTKTKRQRTEKTLSKQEELITIYKKYQKRLREMLRYDFDDMIALVVEAFEDDQLLLREYQEKLHYFLVDEYQDTNAAQNTVVDLLASYWGEQANIFVVGDPHQAIYRFQGASVENMLEFIDRYQQAEVITLTTGYRCFQPNYNAAFQLIGHNELTDASAFKIKHHQDTMEAALNQKLTSPKGTGDKPEIFQAPSQTLELVYLAQQIKKLIETGTKPEEIAVLFRYNSDVVELQEVLQKWDIPYEIDGGVNVLETEPIRQLLQLFKVVEAVRTGQEDIEVYRVMSYQWVDLDSVLVMRAARAAGKAKMTLLELIQAGYEKFSQYQSANGVTALEFATLEQFVDQLLTWASKDTQLVFPKWFELVVNESGFLPWVLEHQAKIELLTNLNTLYREVKALSQSKRGLQLEGFLAAVELMHEHKIALQAEDLNVTTNAIHLSTVHRAKGREWEQVFLIHCIDGKWGNRRQRDLLPMPENLIRNTDLSKKERNEDERRLFYVAITRAKTQAHVSYPDTVITENRSKDVVESMFISEIEDQAERVPEETVAAFVQDSEQYLEQLLKPAEGGPVTTSQKEFFASIVENFALSVTALNTYLRDPEEFVTNVLLRVPRAKPAPMAFGSAVHMALEKYYKHYLDTNKQMKLQKLQDIFAASLKQELLTEEDFQRRLEKGQEALEAYYHNYDLAETDPLFVERFFGYGFSKTYLDDIRLTGRIDRIDWLNRKDKTVRVIDYKTGKPKSVNFIEGQVASAGLSEREQQLPDSIKGPYKRQLLFYKLLTDLDPSFTPVATEGVFDFVQPRKRSGNLVQRQFELNKADVVDLKELIRQVMSEIRQLEFLPLISGQQ